MLSQHVESRHAIELLTGSAAGVGYLLKERIVRPAELEDAVRRIAAGGTAIDPRWSPPSWGPAARPIRSTR